MGTWEGDIMDNVEINGELVQSSALSFYNLKKSNSKSILILM